MRQKANGNIYFNYDSDTEYKLIGYEWNGPIYDQIITSNTQGNSTTKKNGKMGKMTAGAVVGTMLLPGVGTAVDAAIGASGKNKSNTQSAANTRQISTQNEKMSTAIIKLKRISDNTIHSITVNCNSSIDSKIRCFNMNEDKNMSDLSQDINSSLEGIKIKNRPSATNTRAEINTFAAELFISDEDILEHPNYITEQLARFIGYDKKLVELRMNYVIGSTKVD